MMIIFLVLLFALVIVASYIWLLIRIGKISIIGAILTFLFWPVSIYFLVTFWNDEESNIKAPFFINFILCGGIVWLAMVAGKAEYAKHLAQTKAAQKAQTTGASSKSDMDAWCAKQDGAVFNVALGTCVEAPVAADPKAN
jgi:thiol:disulfide interchange protein